MQKRVYAIVLAGAFTVSIAYSIRYGYGMLLPEMLPALAISKTQAGTIFATYFLIYTIFTPILGTLTDLYKYRSIMTVFTGLLSAGAFLMAYVDTFFQACLALSLAGLGHAACWAPVAGLVQKWVPDNRRGVALSIVSVGTGAGLLLWGLLLPAIVGEADWRAGWKAMGFFGFGVTLLNLVLVRDPADAEQAVTGGRSPAEGGAGNPPEKSFWIDYRALFGNRNFWILGCAYMLIGFNVLVPFTFLPVFARESLHLPYSESTRFISTLAMLGIASQLTLGFISDRIGRINVMILCSLFMAIACLGMAFAPNALMLYLTAGIYGMGYGAVWPLYAAAARDFFPSGTIGSVIGLWTVSLGFGSIVSPVICGWTIDHTGSYTWAFLLGLFGGLLSIAALFLVPRRHPRRSPSIFEDATRKAVKR